MDITEYLSAAVKVIAEASGRDLSSDTRDSKILRRLPLRPEYFGDKILEVDCGYGIITCCLAMCFPESSVVGCSSDPEKLAAARILAQHFQLKNVLFQLSDSGTDFPVGKFDTVLTTSIDLRSAAADDKGSKNRFDFYFRRAFDDIDLYDALLQPYLKHLRPDAHFISVVRAEHDAAYFAYCLSLAASETEVLCDTHSQIICRENGEKICCQALIAQNGRKSSPDIMMASDLNFTLGRMDTSGKEFYDLSADVLLQSDAGNLIKGYHIYRDQRLVGKVALYDSVRNDETLWYYTNSDGDRPYLCGYHITEKDRLLRSMIGEIHRQRAMHMEFEWKEIKMSDGWTEYEI